MVNKSGKTVVGGAYLGIKYGVSKNNREELYLVVKALPNSENSLLDLDRLYDTLLCTMLTKYNKMSISSGYTNSTEGSLCLPIELYRSIIEGVVPDPVGSPVTFLHNCKFSISSVSFKKSLVVTVKDRHNVNSVQLIKALSLLLSPQIDVPGKVGIVQESGDRATYCISGSVTTEDLAHLNIGTDT